MDNRVAVKPFRGVQNLYRCMNGCKNDQTEGEKNEERCRCDADFCVKSLLDLRLEYS